MTGARAIPLCDGPSPSSGGAAIRLRRVAPEDLPALAALDARCFPPDIRYDEDLFRLMLGRPCTCFLKTCLGRDRIVGFVLATWRSGSTTRGHLVTLDVDPAFRRRGIGTLLLTSAHRHLAEKGLKKVVLEVYSANLEARRFYRRLGYRVSGCVPDYYGPGRHALRMLCDLGGS